MWADCNTDQEDWVARYLYFCFYISTRPFMSPLQKGQFHRGGAEGAEEARRNSGENLRETPRRLRLGAPAPPRWA